MIGTSLCSALAFFDELLDGGSECPDMGVGCVEGGHPFRWLVCVTFDGDPSDRDDSTELFRFRSFIAQDRLATWNRE